MPNLFSFFSGGDLGVGQRIDIGIDPDRHPCALPARRRDIAEPVQFGNRLDIDLSDVGGERRVEFLTRFADAGKDDAAWWYAGRKCTPQLAFRDDIGGGAETGKYSKDGEVRVGLEGVADKRRVWPEGFDKAAVAAGEGTGRIEVERCPTAAAIRATGTSSAKSSSLR